MDDVAADASTDRQAMDDFLKQETLVFPVAMFKPFPLEAFYVRACFADYYDYITKGFDTMDVTGVTIFGAPRVGTSVFLAYFFLRYQREHPTTTLIVVHSGTTFGAEQAIVWKNGAIVEKLRGPQFGVVGQQYKDDKDAIFLLDGATTKPLGWGHRFVVCLRHSRKWDKAFWKDDDHSIIYMPLWDVDELTAAVRALGLDGKLDRMNDVEGFPRAAHARYDDEVEYRFDVFGGVAGPCLATSQNVVKARLGSLKQDAASVDLMTGYRPRYPGDDYDEFSHRLFHYYPSTDRDRFGIKTASPYVTLLLNKRVNQMHPIERAYFEWKGRQTRAIASFQQSRLAGHMVQQLENGVELVAHSLDHTADDTAFDLKLSIQPSAPTMTRLASQFTSSDLAGGPCFFLQSNAFQSIEALYLVKTEDARACAPWGGIETVVFLALSTFVDRVPGKCLYALLSRLGLADNAPQRVALVFGVPQSRVNFFSKAQFECGWEVCTSSPVAEVEGLTTKMVTMLKTANIHTIHDLRRLPHGVTLNEEQTRIYEQASGLLNVQENETVVAISDSHHMLKQIPQFVWGVKE